MQLGIGHLYTSRTRGLQFASRRCQYIRSVSQHQTRAMTDQTGLSTGETTGSTPTVQFAASMDRYTAIGEKAESPAAERNKQPILEVLKPLLTAEGASRSGVVMEVASGSGQHVAHFAAGLPGIRFQPSDVTSELFGSINAWSQGLPNVLPPILLDASDAASWQNHPARDQQQPSQQAGNGGCAVRLGADGVLHQPVEAAGSALAAVLCINMCHISPWKATQGLVQGAGLCLPQGGLLFIYGPFKREQQHTSESNAAFDASLRARNPTWGYRDIDDVSKLATAAGFVREAVLSMPANNFALVFRKR